MKHPYSFHFNHRTTRPEYERMRRIARFWRVHQPLDSDVPYEHHFCFDYWERFFPAGPYPAEPLNDRLNWYSSGKDIPF